MNSICETEAHLSQGDDTVISVLGELAKHLEAHPGTSHQEIVRKASRLAMDRNHITGMPLMQHGFELSLAPRHDFRLLEWLDYDREVKKPKVDLVNKPGEADAPEYEAWDRTARIVNSWTTASGWIVNVIRHGPPENRRVKVQIVKRNLAFQRTKFIWDTLCASNIYTFRAERRALRKLRRHIGAEPFERYFTTGMFTEDSRASGITYLFRRTRPVVAIQRKDVRGHTRLLAALCLHSEGYYQGTFAGTQTPTDDIIFQLLLLRADEHYFWRKAEHHAPNEIESGL